MRLSSTLIGFALLASLGFTTRVSRAEEVDAAATTEQDAPAPASTHLVVRGSAGGSGRALYDSFVAGGEGDVGVGFDSRFGSYALDFSLFGGVVEGGFTALHGTMGIDFVWPVADFRFGFRPRVGYLDIDRMTTERQFGAYSLGMVGHASLDVSREDGVAVALGIEPSAEVVAALGNDGASADGAAPLLGARGFVEIRWRRDD
jgi:hypothetical protein